MKGLLRRAGFRFRYQPRIFGKPDFRIVGTRLLIFCDSSFWHGRKLSGGMFKRNPEFWNSKMLYNKARDRAVTRVLRGRGWTVLRFWDDEITRHPARVVAKIERKLSPSG